MQENHLDGFVLSLESLACVEALTKIPCLEKKRKHIGEDAMNEADQSMNSSIATSSTVATRQQATSAQKQNFKPSTQDEQSKKKGGGQDRNDKSVQQELAAAEFDKHRKEFQNHETARAGIYIRVSSTNTGHTGIDNLVHQLGSIVAHHEYDRDAMKLLISLSCKSGLALKMCEDCMDPVYYGITSNRIMLNTHYFVRADDFKKVLGTKFNKKLHRPYAELNPRARDLKDAVGISGYNKKDGDNNDSTGGRHDDHSRGNRDTEGGSPGQGNGKYSPFSPASGSSSLSSSYYTFSLFSLPTTMFSPRSLQRAHSANATTRHTDFFVDDQGTAFFTSAPVSSCAEEDATADSSSPYSIEDDALVVASGAAPEEGGFVPALSKAEVDRQALLSLFETCGSQVVVNIETKVSYHGFDRLVNNLSGCDSANPLSVEPNMDSAIECIKDSLLSELTNFTKSVDLDNQIDAQLLQSNKQSSLLDCTELDQEDTQIMSPTTSPALILARAPAPATAPKLCVDCDVNADEEPADAVFTSSSPSTSNRSNIMHSSKNILKSFSSSRSSHDLFSPALHSIPEGKHEEDDSDSSVADSSGSSSIQSSMKGNVVANESCSESMKNLHNIQLHIDESSKRSTLFEKFQAAKQQVDSCQSSISLIPIDNDDGVIRKSLSPLSSSHAANEFSKGEIQFVQGARQVLHNPSIMRMVLNDDEHAGIEQALPIAFHIEAEAEVEQPSRQRLNGLLRELYFMLDQSQEVSPANIIALKRAVLNVEEDLLLGRNDAPPLRQPDHAAVASKASEPIKCAGAVAGGAALIGGIGTTDGAAVVSPAKLGGAALVASSGAAVVSPATAPFFKKESDFKADVFCTDDALLMIEWVEEVSTKPAPTLISSKMDAIFAAKLSNQDESLYCCDKWINGLLDHGAADSWKNFSIDDDEEDEDRSYGNMSKVEENSKVQMFDLEKPTNVQPSGWMSALANLFWNTT